MSNVENYKPSPIETGNVELGDDLNKLAELLAENVHEMWAKTRIEQGWCYGEVYDDAKKTHPCIVPYSMLPESEKIVDRNSSQETLKLIKKLGFEIRKNK